MFTHGVLGLSRPKAMVMSLRDHSMLGEGFPLPGPSVKPSEHEPWPGKSPFLLWPHLPPFSCIVLLSPGPAKSQAQMWNPLLGLPGPNSTLDTVDIRPGSPLVPALISMSSPRPWRCWFTEPPDVWSCSRDISTAGGDHRCETRNHGPSASYITCNIIRNLKITAAEHGSQYGVLLSVGLWATGYSFWVSLSLLLNNWQPFFTRRYSPMEWMSQNKTKQPRAFCTYPGGCRLPTVPHTSESVLCTAEQTSSSTEKGQSQAWGVSACHVSPQTREARALVSSKCSGYIWPVSH